MEATIGITLDCIDIVGVAAFWRQALHYDEPQPVAADTQFHGLLCPPDRSGLHHLTLQRVTERKDGKNRAHIDLFVDDAEQETERLVQLGAKIRERHDGYYVTTVMTDPEGNEFCVVQRPQPSTP